MRHLAPLLNAVLVLPTALAAQTRPDSAKLRRVGDTLIVAAATKVLGSAPMAVPDLPVRSILFSSEHAVFVEQQLPSGKVVAFHEQRGSWSLPSDSIPTAAVAQRNAELAALSGQPLPGERRLLNRQGHRSFGALTVDVITWDHELIALLDRLQPMQL